MVVAYPVHGKQKSMDICLAFARGCGGQVSGALLRPGPAFFYGVNQTNLAVWREVVRTQRDYYYSDNSYWDPCRQKFFRVTKNRLQHSGIGQSDGKRWRRLGLEIAPWRSGGTHILICPQSAAFMEHVIGANRDWVMRTVDTIRAISDRPIRIRSWNANKGEIGKTLGDDLADAHVLVTWSSAAAVNAVLAGVPVVCLGQCAAEPMSTPLLGIETPQRPDGREEWAAVLADNEFTMDELRNGTAWRHLTKEEHANGKARVVHDQGA